MLLSLFLFTCTTAIFVILYTKLEKEREKERNREEERVIYMYTRLVVYRIAFVVSKRSTTYITTGSLYIIHQAAEANLDVFRCHSAMILYLDSAKRRMIRVSVTRVCSLAPWS